MDRQHRNPGLPGDEFETALESHHFAGPGQLPLGEDADHFARFEIFGGTEHRLFRAARGDGNRSGPAEDAAEQGDPEQPVESQEANRTGRRDSEQQRIGVADMVADQEDAPRWGQVLRAFDLRAIEEPGKKDRQGLHRSPRLAEERDSGHRRPAQGQPEQLPARLDMEGLREENLRADRADAHQVGEEIARRDHPAPFLVLGAVLQKGVEGNDEGPADQSQREEPGLKEKAVERDAAEQDEDAGHSERAEGNSPDGNFPFGEPAVEEGPRDDPAAEQHQQPSGMGGGPQAGVGLASDLDEQEVKETAEAIEPSDSARRAEQGLLLPHALQVAEMLPKQGGAEGIGGVG